MLVSFEKNRTLTEMMNDIQNLDPEGLMQVFGEIQTLLVDDSFAQSQGVEVNSYMLRGVKKEVHRLLLEVPEDCAVIKEQAPEESTLLTMMTFEHFKRVTLNESWRIFLMPVPTFYYLYNQEFRTIGKFYKGRFTTTTYSSDFEFWAEVATLTLTK